MVSHRTLFDPSNKDDVDDATGSHLPLLQPIHEKNEQSDGKDNEFDDIENNPKLRLSGFVKLKSNSIQFVPPSLSRANNNSIRSVRSDRVMSSPRNSSLEKSDKPITNPHSLGTFKRQSISLRSIRSLYNGESKLPVSQQSSSSLRNSGGSSTSIRFSSLISRHASNEPLDVDIEEEDDDEDG